MGFVELSPSEEIPNTPSFLPVTTHSLSATFATAKPATSVTQHAFEANHVRVIPDEVAAVSPPPRSVDKGSISAVHTLSLWS